jgi:hypothetical protein
VVLESHTRNKKKCVTTVTGLEGFGVKLSEAAKLFGKKFACGASVVKNATGTEQIDMQVRHRYCVVQQWDGWAEGGGELRWRRRGQGQSQQVVRHPIDGVLGCCWEGLTCLAAMQSGIWYSNARQQAVGMRSILGDE